MMDDDPHEQQQQQQQYEVEGNRLLLGIALVVDDAKKGQHLVFRYPALRDHYRSLPVYSSSTATTTGTIKGQGIPPSISSTFSFSANGTSSSSSSATFAAAIARCETEFHQLTPEVFARLFRPKASLCGKPFQVMIDRVRYLSYPVLTASATKETASDDVLLFNIILAMARVPSRGNRRPKRQLAWVEAVMGEERERVGGGLSEQEAKEAKRLMALEGVLDHLTKALLHEERRCRYVSKEVSKKCRKEREGGKHVKIYMLLL